MMRHVFPRLIGSRQGLALIEFALVSPFILLILFGGIELTRFMLVVQKLDKTAYTIADLTAQSTPATPSRQSGEISVAQMNDSVFTQLQALMDPYDAATNGSAIVSSIRRERSSTLIKWQIATPGGYNDAETISAVSGLSPAAVNAAGAGLRDRPASFTGDAATDMAGMLGYENMIVSEVFFRYRPILADILGNIRLRFTLGETTLVRRIYSRPRNGNLICLPPTFTYDECTNRRAATGVLCPALTGAGSCVDECGDCRANTREWCRANGATALMRCVNGTATNQNVTDGCLGAGTLSCN
jgi:Flp pilus assembly protein TadG